MSNFNKAFEVCLSLEMDDGDMPSAMDYVRELRDAGLLAPDLSEPEVRHLEEVDTDVLAWKSDHVEVGVYKNRIAMDDPPKGSMSPAEARELAHALLAAVNYAEKGQK